MQQHDDPVRRFLAAHPPFDMLPPEARERVARAIRVEEFREGTAIYRIGEEVAGLYAIAAGSVVVLAEGGEPISERQAGECFGERGLFLDGRAPYDAVARTDLLTYRLPAADFLALVEEEEAFARFFGRRAGQPATPARQGHADLGLVPVAEMMSAEPVGVAPTASVAEAAAVMRARGISCLVVRDGARLVGIVTTGDLVGRVLAEGLGGETPVAAVMTAAPLSLERDALALDAVRLMVERGIGHLPVVEGGRAVGIVTRTNLLSSQGLSAPVLLSEIGAGRDVEALARTVARVPGFLAQLVGAGAEHHVVTRLVTDVSDALTRRLLAMAEERLGPAPAGYLWAVCGSQGRREQTGVSDQDNCLILADDARPGDDAYFEALARFVSDGLDACGFAYCPGEMMATTPRWRKPVAAWRGYFRGWIEKPDPMARMLASVMFDLRPIGPDTALFEGLQAETLETARRNSIFIAHMVANSLTHQPPLGLFRGFALIRSGEHKNTVDLKHSGVVPVVDLARLYALMGGLRPIGTRARLVAAREAGLLSESGGQDLLDAYDLIAEIRLEHQARQVRAGARPDNYLSPSALSELERSHLRDAFVVVKTMQSSVAHGRHSVV